MRWRGSILIPGIMEHIERAGIHPETVSRYTRHRVFRLLQNGRSRSTHARLAKALHVIGMINIQFIVCGEDVA